MSATQSLIQLLGAVALLLWGLRMVRTGITRAYGAELRHVISRGVATRARALLAGIGVTVLIQSSTATALIVASFAGNGLIETAPALLVMLGADVGTALVAQVLSLDLAWLSPLLIVVGIVMHRSLQRADHRQIGRAAIGLGLMLLALSIIVATSEPMRGSQTMRAVLSALSGEPLIAVLITAALTFLAHSSLAVVLLIMSFAATGIVSVPLALTMVLGANLGGVLPPILATLNDDAQSRRVTFGNAAFKIIGVALCLPLIVHLPPLLEQVGEAAIRQVVNFHLAFNVAIAVLFAGVAPAAARVAARLIPQREESGTPEHPGFLDSSAIETPTVALGCATREALRMGEIVETMLLGVLPALDDADTKTASSLMDLDDRVDDLYEDIKRYVTKISRQEISEAESHRIAEILSFSTNLEHIGDITENLLELAVKKSRKQLQFSEEGAAEIREFHARITANLKVAMTLFLSGDVEVARKLVEEKGVISGFEREITEYHMSRLRQGRPESVETSALHMDMLRDLRRINSHITAVAYPILDAAGELRKSRLKKRSADAKRQTEKLLPNASGAF